MAYSEWPKALESLGDIGALTHNAEILVAAEALENLQRFDEAFALLQNTVEPDGLKKKLHLALCLRDTDAACAVLLQLVELQDSQPAFIFQSLIEDPYFRYFLSRSNRLKLFRLVDALNLEGQLSFVLHLELGDWRDAALDVVHHMGSFPSGGTVASKVMFDLTHRLILKKIPPHDPDLYSHSDWLEAIWPWLQGRSLVTALRRAQLGRQLTDALRTTSHTVGKLPQSAKLLLKFDDLVEREKEGPQKQTAVLKLLEKILRDKQVPVSDLSSALQNAVDLFGEMEIEPLVKRCVKKQMLNASTQGAQSFATDFVWLDNFERLRPHYEHLVLQSAKMVSTASQTLPNDRKLRYLDVGLKKFPASFFLYRRAVQVAVRLDRVDLAHAYIEKAEQSRRISKENIARLWLDAEVYDIADKMMSSLKGHLQPITRQEWAQSLLKRGKISSALQSNVTETSALKTRLERVGALRNFLVDAGYLDLDSAQRLDSPDKLVPLLEKIVAPMTKTATSIVMVSSTLRPGGAERQVAATAIGLSKRLPPNRPVKLYCRSLDTSIQANFFLSEIQNANVSVRELGASAPSLDISKVSAPDALLELLPDDLQDIARPLYEVLKTERPQICHLWQDKTALAGIFAALLSGVPHIVVSLRSTRPDSRRRFRSYQQGLYKSLIGAFPDRITLLNNSHFGARDYEAWLDLEVGAVGVVHNGFDINGIQDNAKRALPIDFSWKQNSFCLGWVGRFTFEKRPDLWTETAMKLAKSYSDFQAIAVGDGPLLAEMQQKVLDAGLDQRIRFLGVRRPVEPFMDKMNVLLLTSEREGLPNVLIEAQALGIPVVTVNAGGAAEAVDKDITGLVIDDRGADDIVGDLYQAVSTLMHDHDKRQAMGSSAKTWAKNQFSLDIMLENTLHAYYPNTPIFELSRDGK